jgi:serine/threonine-protein kinase
MKPGDETINDFRGPMGRDPLVGSRVDDYEVQSIIGAGAMGIVYRVQHAVIGKPAALKVLKPDYADDPEMVERLIREARTVNAIRHPGIVDIFGFGTLPNGQPYIVMDLLEGEPLDAWVKREAPAPFKKVAPILDEVLGALHAAHLVGVIHRDLKPGNIFFESHPEARSHVKIIDFGLARQADRAGGSVRPTNPGTLIGTPAFMAPEQVLGTKVYPATDLYAVGGIAYQMLTGRIPHEAPSAIEVISQKMKFDPVPPRQWVPSIDEDVDSWVMMLLDREPDRRPESADDARRMLRRIMDGRTRSDDKVKPVERSTRAADLPTAIVSSAPASVPTPALGSNPPSPSGRRVSPSQAPSGPAKAKGSQVQPVHLPPAPGGGVVPKRGWGEAKTMLVDPVSPALIGPTPSISDSSVSSTDPLKEALAPKVGNETLLAEPTLEPQPSALKETLPLADINRTQPVKPVEIPAVQPLEDSGRSIPTDEHELPVPKSKLPWVILVVLLVIIVGGLAVLLTQGPK